MPASVRLAYPLLTRACCHAMIIGRRHLAKLPLTAIRSHSTLLCLVSMHCVMRKWEYASFSVIMVGSSCSMLGKLANCRSCSITMVQKQITHMQVTQARRTTPARHSRTSCMPGDWILPSAGNGIVAGLTWFSSLATTRERWAAESTASMFCLPLHLISCLGHCHPSPWSNLTVATCRYVIIF